MESSRIQTPRPDAGRKRAPAPGNQRIPGSRSRGLRHDHVRPMMFNSNLVNGKGLPVVFDLRMTLVWRDRAMLAGMWEFRTGNTFGALAFCSFGAFWISFWALQVFYAEADRRQRWTRGWRVSVGMGDFHGLHDGRRAGG